ncbi:MAG: hypothetical protein LBP50_00805 [Tannerella sp.]|jgi:hypothetical protein|nr:hypothetical protein [Tannerella sp.]
MAKKKVNIHAQHKLQAAQRKNVYMQKLRYYCTVIGDASWQHILPKPVMEIIYGLRGGPFKIRVAKGEKITKRFVKMLYTYINDEMKSNTLNLFSEGDKKVSLSDYYQYIYPIETICFTKDLLFKGKEKFDAFHACSDRRYEEYLYYTTQIISCICSALNDLNKRCLYTFVYDKVIHTERLPENSESLKYQLVTIATRPLEVRQVKIGEEKRLVCQVGEIVHDFDQSTFIPAEAPLRYLKIPGAKAGEKAPVYIQQHAIDRIMQRAYCSYPSVVLLIISRTFMDKRRIISTGKNQYLIECFYEDLKIGYFAATYVDGILVIRTFLIITHSGTPEGKKLEALTGLQKKDKTYLAIDDLRTLANSDIIDDEEIRELFIKAGCESILELCRRVKNGWEYLLSLDKTTQNGELSKLLHEYIQLGAKDEEYFVNDDEL